MSATRTEQMDILGNEASIQSPSCVYSTKNPWRSFIAYDACLRLCLNSWDRNCTEASEFLRDECMMLRYAFGIQKYQIQPQHIVYGEENHASNAEGTCIESFTKEIREIEVEVKSIHKIAQHMVIGFKNWINSLKATFISDAHEDACSYLLQLNDSSEEALVGSDSVMKLTSKIGKFFTVYPKIQAENLLIQVQDTESAVIGEAKIPLYLLVSDAQQQENVRWWPIYQENRRCPGKIQLSTRVSSYSNMMNSSEDDPPIKTIMYDLVMKASIRACNFHANNLQIYGIWKWLLNEFANYYGVTSAYAKLRYLSYIMSIAIPTKECLVLICDLLNHILKIQNGKKLKRHEGDILLGCEVKIKNLLAKTFQNYKSLDGHSSTGLTNSLGSTNENVSSVLAPAIKLFCLLHDIHSQEAQITLQNHFKSAIIMRCRRYVLDTEELISTKIDINIPDIISNAYIKMATLCKNLSNEIQDDIKVQNENLLPSCIDLPNVSASIYSTQLAQRLKNFFSAFPPSKPAPHVIELLVCISDFEKALNSWSISPLQGGINSRDIFHNYIEVWIKNTENQLVEISNFGKIPCFGISTQYATSPFVENMYECIKENLNEYKAVLNRWPHYALSIESAITKVELTIIKALKKQYYTILKPLKDGVGEKLKKRMQNKTKKKLIATYNVPNELGIFLNTLKRMLDVHHFQVEDCIKSASSFDDTFGKRMSEITIILKTIFRNYEQAIIKMILNNIEINHNTSIKGILEETKDKKEEGAIRERTQVLCRHLTNSIQNLHAVFSREIFSQICKEFWEELGQIALSFLRSQRENVIKYRRSCTGYALVKIGEAFAAEMQRLLGNTMHEKNIESPKSIVEALSILC